MKIKSVAGIGQICVTVTVFACLAFEAFGATRYVNPGDPGAYQTIMSAVAASSAGDIVIVYPGTYQESVSISGITLKALRGPEVTVIQSTGGADFGVHLYGSGSVALVGFRVQGFVIGIYINSSGTTKVSNCIACGNSDVGIYISSNVPTGAQILNNISANNGSDGFYAYYYPCARCTYSGVQSNIAFWNGRFGFNAQMGCAIGCYDVVFGDYNCQYANGSGALGNCAVNGSGSITSNPMLNVTLYYRFSVTNSPCINAGNPAPFYNDPDGSRNDMGAYGGPDAANWWRSPFGGPTIQM